MLIVVNPAGVKSLSDTELSQHEGVPPVLLADAVIASTGPAVSAVHVDKKDQWIVVGLERSEFGHIFRWLPIHHL